MEALRFGRRFFAPDALLALIELASVVGPALVFFPLPPAERHLARAAAAAALGLASLAWFLIIRIWRAPIGRATRRRLNGEVLDAAARTDAYRAILAFPARASLLRVALWTASAAAVVGVLGGRIGASLVVITAAHTGGVNLFRALWYRRILERVRAALLPDLDSLQRFAGSWRESLVLAAFASGTLGVAAVGAFTYFFIPINLEHYLRLETWFPATVAGLSLIWLAWERRLLGPISSYLEAALSRAEQPARDDPRAVVAYRSAQWIPYSLALAKVSFWLVAELALIVQGVLLFGIDGENASLMGAEAFIVTLGVAIYEALWHRSTMRPLLRHLAARHRPPPERVRTPLSLRNKMLVGFGALSLFAIGLQQFWSFMQYKTTVTQYITRECELRLEATLADLKERRASSTDEILTVLHANVGKHVAPREEAFFYYLPPSGDSQPIAVGDKAPPLPWTAEALMRRLDRGQMELSALHLTGAYTRVYADKQDLGSIALLLPGYRGRGPSTAPQIQLLVGLTLLLLLLSAGFVALLAIDLTRPIRELERRATGMARGDLTQPVVSTTGEADEVGRLAYALEEMRQELNRKFRSSTEINLSLEQEVARRTAELERRNKELADALEQLRRAQDELVRSEKMASMGRLVAGIAHEINNPVNAVVNTVGPLAEALAHEKDVDDIQEMLRVIQRGAKRTKEIVQALHNYSRGDDDRVVEVDVHRGLDESLDLLRHHLKNGIQVERHYGEVGRVKARNTINQVFMNLLTNAAQALADPKNKTTGGKITIRTERDDSGKVIVKIGDDGPGIPPELLPRIFDPFFTTKDVGEGSGLGLSIVHGIVERHGGSISVDSEVGRGTTFTVTLPQS